MKKQVAVIGAGSWGTTMAICLADKGTPVHLWDRRPERARKMNEDRINAQYLPGAALPPSIEVTSDLEAAVSNNKVIVMAVPSHAMREVCQAISGWIRPDHYFITLSKGIENDTLKRMSEIISEILRVPAERIATLSGPSHAEELSRKIPTAVVVASVSLDTARRARELFRSDYLRVYSSNDITGVEVGGALKNVIAIAAGICDGAGFGDNTKAALLTRALAEITRCGLVLGARAETFAGLSGMGDLIVTCMSRHSRNRFVGEQIGRGLSLDEVLAKMTMVAEGIKTTRSVHQLAKKVQVEMPIAEEVYQVLFHNKKPQKGVYDLMTRDPKEEQFS